MISRITSILALFITVFFCFSIHIQISRTSYDLYDCWISVDSPPPPSVYYLSSACLNKNDFEVLNTHWLHWLAWLISTTWPIIPNDVRTSHMPRYDKCGNIYIKRSKTFGTHYQMFNMYMYNWVKQREKKTRKIIYDPFLYLRFGIS